MKNRTASLSAPRPPTKAPFPLRAACVDMGSNAIRFFAAEFGSPPRSTVLDDERLPVRLGAGVFLSGRLDAAAMEEALASLAGLPARLQALKIDLFRMVATSAVREAVNGKAFLERVERTTGLRGETISGYEEARLIHRAVRGRVPMGRRPWLMVDVGGGSVEVTLADTEGLVWSESHTMGAVRLLEELAGGRQEPGHLRRLLEEYVATLNLPAVLGRQRPAGLIATGGNIDALALLAGALPPNGGPGRLPRADLRKLIGTLSRLSHARRVRDLGLRPDRADVILPAALVYDRAAELAGAREIWVPRAGLKEGLLLDLVEDAATHRDHVARQDRQTRAGALALGRRYRFDEAHAEQVASLALSLFDQLRPLHGLGETDRRLLTAAALLHDIGSHVSYRKHHKHSLYLIAQSELPGFSAEQMLLTANIARYHRKAEPGPTHPDFADLPRGDQRRVRKLAALLRVADALDREHLQAVRGIRARGAGRTVRLRVDGTGDRVLERWALRRKAGLFERTYGRELILTTGGKP
jgi:exopolyphosphatase/guanosine-5'-triphosphate,3'-diphosphate pyrophosphatase